MERTTNKKGLAAINDQTPGTTNSNIVDQADGESKATERMKAEAALAGCGLYPLLGGGFLLTRWGMARECPDLPAVAVLLARMTGGAR